MADATHLVITGPMGVGKTTLAGLLAETLDRPVRDSDADIETLFGRPGRDIAAVEGVDALHDLEAAVLFGALAGSEPSVIGAAGWVVEDQRCRAALARRATVLVLELGVDELIARLAAVRDEHRRPMDAAEVRALAARRRPLYEEVADHRLDAAKHPAELAAEVVGWLAASDRL